MTIVTMSMPISPVPSRVRIAITSPDILAQIRQVFADKNLAVDIVRMPYIEVAVRPVAGAVPTDRAAVGTVLRQLGGPAAAQAGTPAARRLCAEYRLDVVEVGGWPRAGQPEPEGRRHQGPAPEPGAGSPAAALSQRQHEVMALVSRGARNAEIAARLHVSEKTVKNHINRIFRSLGAGSRVEAVLIWQRQQRDAAIRRGAPGPAPVPAGEWHRAHEGTRAPR